MTIAFQVNKRFTYRGNPNEVWGNRYMLTGAAPVDAAAWRTLFNALTAQEATILPGISIVGGYGYDSTADDATAVWSVDLTLPPNSPVVGTLSNSGGTLASGDTAWWIRWKLDRQTEKHKAIYLRKYYHPAIVQSGFADTILPGVITAGNAFALKMRDGTFAEARKICDKDGNVPSSHAVGPYATTRSLKRRGKRNPT